MRRAHPARRRKGLDVFRLLFAVYVVVEVAALWAVAATLGAGWAVLLLMAGTAAGVIAFGAQTRRLFAALAGRRDDAAPRRERGPAQALADGSLSMTGVALLLVPGLVTSVLGLALLFPPTRMALRPVVLALGLKRYPAAGMAAAGARRAWGARRTVVVDGEVVTGPAASAPRYGDVHPPVLPPSSGRGGF